MAPAQTPREKEAASDLLHPDAGPFVLCAMSEQGQRITTANITAQRAGVEVGMPLADARAIYPSLMAAPAKAKDDQAALIRLALWCQCYSPYTRIDDDGLAIDITGCSHLFGGEPAMLHDIVKRLGTFGLTAKLAAAPTIGAAWAGARYGPGAITMISTETLHDHLASYCVAALRLEAPVVAGLKRLGLQQIRDLLGKPRAPLAARFGHGVVERLDSAFGKKNEVFSPLSPPPFYRAERRFIEPLITSTSIEYAVDQLACELAGALADAGKGARRVRLSLFRVDGWSQSLDVHTSALSLSRDGPHLTRLFCERLDAIKDEAGFGFETASLGAYSVEQYDPYQNKLTVGDYKKQDADDLARLLDRFVNRFGAQNVTRFIPNESYILERSFQKVTALKTPQPQEWAAHRRASQGGNPFSRPLLMFASPEPVITLAEVPDGPPVRFEWRRKSHRVVKVDGPERMAPEWWRNANDKSPQTRDYYRVEDQSGRRFWLYRDGLHERPKDHLRWFIHGLFA